MPTEPATPSYTFGDALELMAADNQLPVEVLLDAVRDAVLDVYRQLPDAAPEASVQIDPSSGKVTITGRTRGLQGQVTGEWDDTRPDFGRAMARPVKEAILNVIKSAGSPGTEAL